MKNVIPFWIKSGLFIFPVIIIVSMVLNFLSGNINPFVWLIIPSIIFEGIFENCCYTFSNIQIVNLFFAFIFWFIIGAVIGEIANKFISKINKY